jgi:hypothetical protein
MNDMNGIDLSVDIAGVKLANPSTAAAWTCLVACPCAVCMSISWAGGLGKELSNPPERT